jgi:hypothetical protein
MMLALQDRGCRNINLVTPVELPQDRQQDINAVLEPARRRLLDVSQSFNADEVRVLSDYFTRAAPALMAAQDELQARATSPSISRRQPTAGHKPVTRHRIRHRRWHRTSGLPGRRPRSCPAEPKRAGTGNKVSMACTDQGLRSALTGSRHGGLTTETDSTIWLRGITKAITLCSWRFLYLSISCCRGRSR